MDDGSPSIVGAGHLAEILRRIFFELKDQALENLSEHFRVDGNLYVQWSIFHDREVVSFKQVVEYGLEGGVLDMNACFFESFSLGLSVFLLEEATVEERHDAHDGI